MVEKNLLYLLPTDNLEAEVRRIGLDTQYLDKVYSALKNELSLLSAEELADKYKRAYMDWKRADNDLHDAHMFYNEYYDQETLDALGKAELELRYHLEALGIEVKKRRSK